MSAKYVINQIHRFNFLAVNDFRVNLRSLYVGMAEQLARGIKIRTEGKHHCGERVAARRSEETRLNSSHTQVSRMPSSA